MFESVSVASSHQQERKLRWKTLPASLFVHGLVLAAVPVSGAWKVVFPTQPPPIMTMYNLAEPPLPPPPPPPPAAPKPQPEVQLLKKVEVPTEIVAPTVIPDEIPDVTQSVVEFVAGVPEGVEGGVEGGVADGSIGGVQGGEIGGTVGSILLPPPPPPVDDGRVYIPRDANLNMFPLSKTYPIYPEKARLQRWEDQLVVRYVIGKNGRVKEVTVLEKAGRKIFDEAAVDAIRHWRFRPLIKDGEAQEVVHELTVYFRLNA